MIDAFQNGMWSSMFKYDYIHLMFAEGDLSVDLKGKKTGLGLLYFVYIPFTHSD